MNSLQAAREIRRICPSSKIIFVTSTSDDAVRRAAREIGDGYILKDNVLKDLVATVTACFSS
jgi:DNA-binding NarL/FixJ family response regulator